MFQSQGAESPGSSFFALLPQRTLFCPFRPGGSRRQGFEIRDRERGLFDLDRSPLFCIAPGLEAPLSQPRGDPVFGPKEILRHFGARCPSFSRRRLVSLLICPILQQVFQQYFYSVISCNFSCAVLFYSHSGAQEIPAKPGMLRFRPAGPFGPAGSFLFLVLPQNRPPPVPIFNFDPYSFPFFSAALRASILAKGRWTFFSKP